jgi:hypothetical protein
MALVLKDRIKETSNTTGQGTLTLTGAVDGFRTFADIGNTNTTYYCITDGNNFEVGIGTYTASGTTLARTTVLQTSAGNTTKISCTGNQKVFVTQPASKAAYLDASNELVVNNTPLSTIQQRWTKTASSNQTAFSGAADSSGPTLAVNSTSHVFLNGIFLKETTDYALSGGTTVTLTAGATLNDIVEVITFTPLTTATTGITSGKVPVFTSGVADNDFLKIDGTSVEGRSASEVRSDLGLGSLALLSQVAQPSMALNTVNEAILQVSNTPTNNYFLQAQSGNTGGLTWAEVDLSSYLTSSTASSTYAPLAGATFTGAISGTNATLSGYLRGPSSFTIDPAAHGDNTGTVVIAGNLQVDGTTTTINSTTVAIDDLNFSIATDAADSAAANGAGITIGGAGATFNYTHADTSWNMNKSLNITGAVTATTTINAGSNGGFYLTQDSSESVIRSEGQPIILQTFAASAWNDRLTVTNGGNVGIGITPATKLDVSNGTERHQVSFASGEVYLMARNASAYITQEYIANQHVFTGYGDSSSNEAMRLDGSGNLLVGTLDTSLYNNTSGGGLVYRPGNELTIAAETSPQLIVNLTGNDGEMIRFADDGSTVGYIGLESGSIHIGGGDVGIGFYQSADALVPLNPASGALRNEQIDLGLASGGRYKDVHCQGMYVGATNTSYDFYNNGTTYLNGALTVDNFLTVSGTGAGVSIDGGTSNNGTDATLYVTATNNNDWGLIIDKASAGEYAQDIRVATGASYAFRVVGGGAEQFRITGTGQVYSQSSIYATQFVDINSSTYLVDPASTSKLNYLNLLGTLQSDGNSGTSGQVFTSNGGSRPTWQDAGGSGWEHVTTYEGNGSDLYWEITVERGYYYKVYFWDVQINNGGSRNWDIRFNNYTNGLQKDHNNNYITGQGWAGWHYTGGNSQASYNGSAERDADNSSGSTGWYSLSGMGDTGSGYGASYGNFEYYQPARLGSSGGTNNPIFKIEFTNNYRREFGIQKLQVDGTSGSSTDATFINKIRVSTLQYINSGFYGKFRIMRLKDI